MRPHNGAPNLLGRLIFLRATERHWPEPLNSLLDANVVLPDFGTPEPLEVSQLMHRAGGKEVGQQIEAWADRLQLRDSWIQDAALQTLIQCARTRARIWYYHCAEMRAKSFSLQLPPWTPPSIIGTPTNMREWKTFQRNATRTFRTQLKQYRARTESVFGGDRPLLAMHALWTALWQRGKTAAQIQLWLERTHRRKVTATNIQIRVREFADDIGLTLRKSKSGPSRT
jgi:hypothetical protein